jgi:hypothetical protein
MMHNRIAWIDFYNTQQPTPIDKQTYTSRLSPSTSSVHVSNCLFKSITSTDSGGALFCSTSVIYFLVESSSFFSCKTSASNGGAIYFSNSNNGQSVLYEVCSYDCCSGSSSNGQFAYIYMSNSASSKICVNYSSIVRCLNENSGAWRNLYLYYGINYCPSINMSMNKCQSVSGIYCFSYIDSNSVTCSFTYSSFVDNYTPGYNCLYLEKNDVNYEIKYCNIIRNTQVSTAEGIIHSDGNLVIDDSCILENNASRIFYSDYSTYTVILSNCTVDSTTTNQNLILQNTVTKSFIHALNHMSTENCHIGYDAVGYLTAIPYISHTTKKIHCYTNNGIHNHARISDFFSVNWVFMVAFIHAHPSINY